MLAQRTMTQQAPRRVVYTAPGAHTFTVPAGVSLIYVTLVGGGGFGGAGSGSPNFRLGGGGGAGGAARFERTVTAGNTLSLTVGTGGQSFFAGGNSIAVHDASGDTATAFGGGAGGTSTDTIPGAGGTGGSFGGTGLWGVSSSQTGANGNTGQAAGDGAGGVFTTFRGVSGGRYGFGFQGMVTNIPNGQAGAGIVIVEW